MTMTLDNFLYCNLLAYIKENHVNCSHKMKAYATQNDISLKAL